MTRFDPTNAEIRRALSSSVSDSGSLQRRRFLQAAAAVGGAAMLPLGFAEMAGAASPIGPTDGVLVILNMEGGNDGLNTVAPTGDGAYYDLRKGVAIAQNAALQIGGSRGLHPELGYLKGLFDNGQVAVIDGVGDPGSNLSHFESTARWMTGRAGNGAPTSGWVGRYMDGLPGGADPFHAVAIGRTVPLLMQGNRRTATALPANPSGLFDFADAEPWELKQMAAFDAMAAGSTGLGSLADAIAESGRSSLAIARDVSSVYQNPLPEGDLAADLVLAARLINANLGIRVIEVSYGDFDGHAGHVEMHRKRMQELNAALTLFHQTLAIGFANRTTILTVSEFGRRAKANNSGGVDHGSASTLMAIGPRVKGGFYGEFPSLTALDRRGNQAPTVDFRSVYATVLADWLGADDTQVLGGTYERLGFLSRPDASNGLVASDPLTIVNQRAQVMRLYLAYFLRMPDEPGLDYWVSSLRQGLELREVSQVFSESPEFVARYGQLGNPEFVDLIYRNVLGRNSDAAGRTYWAEQLANGTSRGQVMVGFSESVEYQRATTQKLYDFDSTGAVARLYEAYFLREADKAGLAYWTGLGTRIESISESFAGSNEFKARYGTLSDQAFVELVYRNVMDREPDAPGLSFWVDKLYGGTSRGQVMLNFSESVEFKTRFTALRG